MESTSIVDKRQGDCTPYSPEHRKRTKERIIRSAQVLFNRHGFDAISIDQIMADAGLTRGGFYEHFETKSDSGAGACNRSGAPPYESLKGVTHGSHPKPVSSRERFRPNRCGAPGLRFLRRSVAQPIGLA